MLQGYQRFDNIFSIPRGMGFFPLFALRGFSRPTVPHRLGNVRRGMRRYYFEDLPNRA